MPIAPALFLGRLGFTPNALTIIGSALTASVGPAGGSGLVRGRGHLPVVVFSATDTLDGALARATDRVTVFGAFLDSVCDRYAEAAVFLGVRVVLPDGGADMARRRLVVRGDRRLADGELRPRTGRGRGPAGRGSRLVPASRAHHHPRASAC